MNKIPLFVTFLVFVSFFYTAVAQDDDWRSATICTDGDKRPCGSNIGVCKTGEVLCAAGAWGECTGVVRPNPDGEICSNNLDDDCNGTVDDCIFEFPIPGWLLVAIGVMMFLGAWVYEKMVVVKREEMNQEEPSEQA